MKKIKLTIKDLFKKVLRIFNSFVFVLVPRKITHLYVILSILAVIYQIKCIKFRSTTLNMSKLNILLRTVISDDILLFPEYSINLLWNDELLNNKFLINGTYYTLNEIIKDNKLLFHHLSLVINEFLDNLPNPIKLKLRLGDIKNKLKIKHNIEHALILT